MKRLLPTQSDIESDPDQPATVIDISDTRGDAIFEALSSATARQILTAVYEKPRSASDLAEQTDTSLQNINYHIEKLQEVDLIKVVDTVYSPQGREMKVYGPTNNSLVLFAGDEETESSVRQFLKRLGLTIGSLAVMSIIIEMLSTGRESILFNPFGGDIGVNASDEFVGDAGNIIATGSGIPPGVIFFLGGLFVILVVFGLDRYYQ